MEAARRMHLTQSALSHQLKDLEDRLGVALFLRKSKPLRFTRAGLELLQLADSVLPLLRQAERNLQKMAGGHSGRLHMVIECHSCFDWLMPAINSFRDHWPEVEIDLSTSFHFEPIPALQRGDIDLVVTSDPRRTGRSCITNHCFAISQYWRWPISIHWCNSAVFSPPILREETLIHYPVDRHRLDIFERFLTPKGIEPKATRTNRADVNDGAISGQWPWRCLPAQLGPATLSGQRPDQHPAVGEEGRMAHALRRHPPRTTGQSVYAGFLSTGFGQLLPAPARHSASVVKE